MEKIYVAHSKIIDYQEDLYEPIKNCSDKYEFIFPHEKYKDIIKSSKYEIKECKLLIAEVSKRATGLGIEIGWAECLSVPIIAIYKKGTKVSSSVKLVSNILMEYNDTEDMVEQLTAIIANFDNIMSSSSSSIVTHPKIKGVQK